MKFKLVVGGALAAAILVACTVCAGCDDDSSAGHWEGGGASLDWPEGWKVETSEGWRSSYLEVILQTEALCELSREKPYARTVLMTRDLVGGETLQSVFDRTYSEMAEFHGDSFREVTGWSTSVNGLPALVKSYEAPSGEPYYQYQDVWLERDGRLFVLTVWAHTAVDEQEIPADFEEIVRGLDVGGPQ